MKGLQGANQVPRETGDEATAKRKKQARTRRIGGTPRRHFHKSVWNDKEGRNEGGRIAAIGIEGGLTNQRREGRDHCHSGAQFAIASALF
jgi:hypothetical protein